MWKVYVPSKRLENNDPATQCYVWEDPNFLNTAVEASNVSEKKCVYCEVETEILNNIMMNFLLIELKYVVDEVTCLLLWVATQSSRKKFMFAGGQHCQIFF